MRRMLELQDRDEIYEETGKPDAAWGIWWVFLAGVSLAIWWGAYLAMVWVGVL